MIGKIYDGTYNAQLSFTPVRKRMAGWVMQMREQTWQSSVLDKAVFPLHARGLSKSKIGDALERFSRVVKVAVDLQAVRVRWGSPEDKVDFLSFAHECMLDAGIAALFGQSSGLQIEEIKRHFKALDNAMPLLATCIVPGPIQPYCTLGGIAAGAESRDALKGLLAEWVRSGGHTQLDERNVIYTVVTEMLKLGWDDNDIGSMLAISLWVSLANSPLAVCWTLVYLSQADPSLLSDLRKELNDLAGSPASTADLPLLTSCYYETLRLQASTYSVRWCTADVIIGQQTQVKAGERVACLTRASQMDEAIWGEDASVWDGRRFYDDPHAIDRSVGESKSSKIASVRAFGGGPSKVRLTRTLERDTS